MKAIIENTPVLRWNKNSNNVKFHEDHHRAKEKLMRAFTDCIYQIVASDTEDTLRAYMESLVNLNYDFSFYFTYGFGHSHMWVHQIDKNGTPRSERIIFVEIPEKAQEPEFIEIKDSETKIGTVRVKNPRYQ